MDFDEFFGRVFSGPRDQMVKNLLNIGHYY